MDLESFKEFTCGVCMEVFGSGSKCPRILTCGHCFCHSCLETLVMGKPMCPICYVDLKYTRADYVPINYPIKSLVESLQAYSISKMKEGEEIDYSTGFLSEGYCKEHSIPKQFRCMDCEDWVCGNCASLNHKTCRTELVRDALKEMQLQETTKLEEVLRIKMFEDQGHDIIRDHFVERILVFKQDINKLQVQLRKKINDFANLKNNFQDFLEQEQKRQSNWSSLAASEMPTKEFYSCEDFLNERDILHSHMDKLVLENVIPLPAELCINLDMQILKNLLDEKTAVYAVRSNGKKSKFARLEVSGETIKIHSFHTKKPLESHFVIPFRHILFGIMGSRTLPDKTFFEIYREGTRLGEVTVAIDSFSPRALNFLLLCSGLNRLCYKGTQLLHRKDTLGTGIVSELVGYSKVVGGLEMNKNGKPIIKGIKDYGLYEAPTKIGFVCGCSNTSPVYSTYFSFRLEEKPKNLLGKFGEVVNGLEVLSQIEENETNVYIKQCGLIFC